MKAMDPLEKNYEKNANVYRPEIKRQRMSWRVAKIASETATVAVKHLLYGELSVYYIYQILRLSTSFNLPQRA